MGSKKLLYADMTLEVTLNMKCIGKCADHSKIYYMVNWLLLFHMYGLIIVRMIDGLD